MAATYIKQNDGLKRIGDTQGLIAPLEVYSTEETKVGIWIDGKPIYKKTLPEKNLGGAGTYTINHGISNFKQLIKLEAVCFNNERTSFYTFPSGAGPDQNEFHMNATTANIVLSAGGWGTGWNFQGTVYYTKTTD
jgi:hypothetical protein